VDDSQYHDAILLALVHSDIGKTGKHKLPGTDDAAYAPTVGKLA
jgi:hypothetical protein